MKVEIRQVAADDQALLAELPCHFAPEQASQMVKAFGASEQIWVGLWEGKIAIVWGLCPGSVLSDTALIWSWSTPVVMQCRKTFVRLSRLAVAQALQAYPTLTGFCSADSHWLRWLGAEIGPGPGEFSSFTIRA